MSDPYKDVIFQQDTLQRPPKCGLRTSPSGSSLELSPDLNPIENIWSHIKHKLTGKYFSTSHKLFETINIEWNNIDSSFCKRVVHKFTHKAEPFEEIKGKIYAILYLMCLILAYQ